MTVEEHISQEEYRGACYKSLSDCYYLPDAGLLKMISDPDGTACGLYSGMVQSIKGLSDIESIQVDYSRLFVGPYGLLAPPYGSVYLENKRMLIGDSTLDVRRRYAKEGLRINFKEAPNHIAIELEFMYFLIHKEVEAALVGDSAQAVDYIRKQRDFLEVHLVRWVCDLTALMAAKAETAFYRELANVTKTFIEADVQNLSDITPYDLPAQRANGKTEELLVRKEL